MKTKKNIKKARKNKFSENLEKFNIVILALSLIFYLYTISYVFYTIIAPIIGREIGLEALGVIFTGAAAIALNALLITGLVVQAWYERKNHILSLSTKKLLVISIILPILGAALYSITGALYNRVDNYRAAQTEKEFNAEHVKLKDDRYRTLGDEKFLKSFKPNVYLPKWENENAVEVADKSLQYHLEYRPGHKKDKNEYDDVEGLEYFRFLIRENDSSLRKFVNPPYNCDIDGIIPPISRQPKSIPCVYIGRANNGSVIYGQDDWMNSKLDRYAVIFFDSKSPHLIKQSGDSEMKKGGELQQLINWQKDFRKFDKNGLLLED